MKSRYICSQSAADAAERILRRSCLPRQKPVESIIDARSKFERRVSLATVLRQFSKGLGSYVSLPMILKFMCMVSTRLPLSARNLYRLLLIGIILSVKILKDTSIDNTHFSNATNIPLDELNTMEREFLKLCEYQLFVSEHEYACYLRSLVKETLRS